MNSVLLLRLCLDLVAAGLLFFGFSYWWLGNSVHEAAGTAMFVLIIVHNVFNRRFYGRLKRAKHDTRGLFNVGVTMTLIVVMVTLLGTSLLISNTLAPIMSAFGGFTVIQLHALAAYWALVIVAVHLGLRWPMIMATARGLANINGQSTIRTWGLRLIAVAIAVHGIWSSFVLGMGTKLSMQVTLDWWNFEESVFGFFVHCLAVAGLYITTTYYAVKWLPRRKRVSAGSFTEKREI